MKYKIAKNDNNEFVVKEIIDVDGNPCSFDFDYAKMINFLFNNKGLNLDIEYAEEITQDEQAKINALFQQIKEIFTDKTEIGELNDVEESLDEEDPF